MLWYLWGRNRPRLRVLAALPRGTGQSRKAVPVSTTIARGALKPQSDAGDGCEHDAVMRVTPAAHPGTRLALVRAGLHLAACTGAARLVASRGALAPDQGAIGVDSAARACCSRTAGTPANAAARACTTADFRTRAGAALGPGQTPRFARTGGREDRASRTGKGCASRAGAGIAQCSRFGSAACGTGADPTGGAGSRRHSRDRNSRQIRQRGRRRNQGAIPFGIDRGSAAL